MDWCLLSFLVIVAISPCASSQCQSSTEGREFMFGIIETTRKAWYLTSTNQKSNDTVELHITNISPHYTRIHLEVPYSNINTYYNIPPDQSKSLTINPSIQKLGTFREKRGVKITSEYDVTVLVTCIKTSSNETAVESYNVLPTRSAGRRYFATLTTWYGSSTIMVTSNVNNNLVRIYNTTGLVNASVIGLFDVYQYHCAYCRITDLLIEAESDITVVAGLESENYWNYYYYGENHFKASTLSMIPTKYWSNRYIVPKTRHADTARVRILSENIYPKFTLNTNFHSSVSDQKNLSFANSSAVLTSEKKFSILQSSFYSNNTADDFMVLVPGVDQYISDYRFTVPHLHSNTTPLYIHMTNYITIIVPTVFQNGVVIDGVPVQYIGNSSVANRFQVPSPFNNYTVMSFETGEGYHRVSHRMSHVKFGLLVYGFGKTDSDIYNSWYSDIDEYTMSYGYFAGFNLQGGMCEHHRSEATTSSVSSIYPTASSVSNIYPTASSVSNMYPTASSVSNMYPTAGTNGPNANETTMCYSCEDLGTSDLCDTVKPCHRNEVCFIERQSKSGRTVYRSGCLAADVCSSEHQLALSKGDLCVDCCSESFCNNKGCGDAGLPSRNYRGPVCFDCQHVSSPELCTSVTLCSQHQICRIERLSWGDGYHYKMGCVNGLCDPLTKSVHSSKRSTPVCHHCCMDDYCNKNCTRLSNVGDGSVLVG